MGKKKSFNYRAPGSGQPNKQNNPPPLEPEAVYDSDDSMVLDYIPESNRALSPVTETETEDEELKRLEPRPIECVKVDIQQLYKDPYMAKHYYTEHANVNSAVVSSQAAASEIDYKIKLEPYESKSKQSTPRQTPFRQREWSGASSGSQQSYFNSRPQSAASDCSKGRGGPPRFYNHRRDSRYRPSSVCSGQSLRPASSASSTTSYAPRSSMASTPIKSQAFNSSRSSTENGSGSKTPLATSYSSPMDSMNKRFGLTLRFANNEEEDFDDNASLHSSVFEAPVLTIKGFHK